MSKSAIIIGVSNYDNLTNLDCCQNDVIAIEALLSATKRFDNIISLTNEPAGELKDKLREFISKLDEDNDEVFFYFSGHGIDDGNEFYFCLSDYDEKSLHSTALSNQELHGLIRTSGPKSFVKIVDACESGTQMIKSGSLERYDKAAFESFILMAACLSDQSTWTGKSLSLFTDKFISAAINKDSGPVYYTDIEAFIRDTFANNRNQTPYFIHQGTHTEVLTEDSSFLNDIKKLGILNVAGVAVSSKTITTSATAESSLIDQLKAHKEERATLESAQNYISNLKDSLLGLINTQIKEVPAFELRSSEADEYYHLPTKSLAVPILEGQDRTDELVTAQTYQGENSGVLGGMARLQVMAAQSVQDPLERAKSYILKRNCQLDNVELTIELIPRFEFLKKFTITVSAMPSFPICYVFLVMESHMLTDWNSFGRKAKQVTRKWYKGEWSDGPDWIANLIYETVLDSLNKYFKSEGYSLPNEDVEAKE